MSPYRCDDESSHHPIRLFLRHFFEDSTANWSKWGRPVPGSPGLWSFYAQDRDHLLDLVEVLTLGTPPHALKQTIVLSLPEAGDEFVPLSLLDDFIPLPVLYARLHQPWILENLADRVESHLQPIVDLLHGGKVFAYEALGRLRTPDGRLLSGHEAFTLAKRASRLKALDLACFRSALSAKSRLLPRGTPVFVNVLPHNLAHGECLHGVLRSFLDELKLSPEETVIELVESERVEADTLVDTCDTLRDMGFRIALDDVGTGYNGLATLAALRPDFVKLDRSLVHGIQTSRVRMVLLEALISMSQRLGCATIAEGLERVEDVLLCQEMGVNFAQGYFFARPSLFPREPNPVPPRKAATAFQPRGMVQLADYVDLSPTLPTTATVAEARSLFRTYPELTHIVLLDDKRPVGTLARTAMGRVQPSQLAAHICRPVTKLLRDHMARPHLLRLFYTDTDPGEPWIVVNEDDLFLGTLDPWVILSQIASHTDTADLHPLSLLPTGPVLRSTLDLQLQLQSGKAFVLVYIDIDNFKAFNDRYGFIRGDAMIKLLAEILRQQRTAWNDATLGHIGGDDFIVVFSSDRSNLLSELLSVTHLFHHLSALMYDKHDLRSGYFETESGDRYPVAALSVIVVNGCTGPLADSLAASERAAHLKKLAKSQPGSVVVVEGQPPQVFPIPFQSYQDSWRQVALRALEHISGTSRDRTPHDLDKLFETYPFFELVYELDARGIQCRPNWIHPQFRGRIKGGGAGTDRSAQPYYREVAATQKPYVSDIYVSIASQEFCATISIPLMNSNGDGTLTGVLVADINLPGLVELLKRSALEACSG